MVLSQLAINTDLSKQSEIYIPVWFYLNEYIHLYTGTVTAFTFQYGSISTNSNNPRLYTVVDLHFCGDGHEFGGSG